ncbi:MAG: hypothetical protein HY239_01340 [Mycolicibacterium aromaticivorans]|nr:hypothetical protein [Mycolicibacterium aromaticivorans]
MVPFWFTLSALCFVGAAVLLYVDIGRRRGLGRRRKSWARSHGFDFEPESAEIIDRWKRGVMSTVGDVTARNVVLGQIRGEAVYVFDRMVTFAHTAPDCAEIMWNEQNWTLVSMPISSTRAQWDEGLRTVRQFNDLLRVLPPTVQPALTQSAGRRNASPGRPLAPAGRRELPPGHVDAPPPLRPQQPRSVGQTGTQAPNYQR